MRILKETISFLFIIIGLFIFGIVFKNQQLKGEENSSYLKTTEPKKQTFPLSKVKENKKSNNQKDLSADESRLFYETGESYFYEGNMEKASLYFKKAASAGGNFSDPARLFLIRIMAYEKRKKSESRESQVKSLLNQMENENLLPRAWFIGLTALYDYGETDISQKMALEAIKKFRGKPFIIKFRLFLADTFYKQKKIAASLNQLLYIAEESKVVIRRKKTSEEYLSDYYGALRLLSRLYNTPGEFYAPKKAAIILEKINREN